MSFCPTVSQVLELFERVAPARLAESWDNPGLQLGHPDQKVEAVLAALDPSERAVEEAASRGAGLLITHHPLFFKPLFSLDLDSYPGNVVRAAVNRGISLASIHTNLDAASEGISYALADAIGLHCLEVLEEARKDEGVGLGRVGNLEDPENTRSFLARLKDLLEIRHLRLAGPLPQSVRRIAVVGGSGGGMISAAVRANADMLITGDITHHQALEARERGLVVVDGGHFATERAVFFRLVRKFFSTMAGLGWTTEVYTAEEVDPVTVL